MKKPFTWLLMMCLGSFTFFLLEFPPNPNSSQVLELKKGLNSSSKLEDSNSGDFKNSMKINTTAFANRSESFISQYCKYRLGGKEINTITKPQICLYNPEEDISVSGTVAKGEVWDYYIVNRVLERLTEIRDSGQRAVFMDIGANIGIFTLSALAKGFDVISVDALQSAIERLSTSIVLNDFTQHSQLVFAAISDKHGCVLNSIVDPKDQGATRVKATDCEENVNAVRTVQMDDILQLLPQVEHKIVMKIDIEGFEPFAILGGEKFFETAKITYICMEWVQMQRILKGITKPWVENQADHVIKAMELLMDKYGYKPYNYNDQPLLWENRLEWPTDIILKPTKEKINR